MVKGKKEFGPVSIDYTIRLARLVKDVAFKKRAPRAIREMKKQAERVMKTKDVRIEQKLNEAVWANGIRFLPRRLRVRFNRKRNEDEEAAEKFYTLISYVECSNFKGLKPEIVKDQ
eukprot:Gregarina_sp_Poly_1__6481@NODE_346_length_9378_cov_211_258941_g289_i0_p8_GENE_NODE_346_length_9378_cov_211_258941_g289_i0NODE_346_length_9378_cov_211_258941_g289_i0_p8_ORF_typecomplete_len116_score25_02Ribosomal_L31e/PF01198_19/3_2e28Vsr/PF03852_15/9_8e03Vsr/PF03852_15/0_043_NODE_346_length_9378_cov_211_258941_g289_i0104451